MNKIEYFEKIINENKNIMLQLSILYDMSCHYNYDYLSNNQKEKLLGVIYSTYILDESNTDMEKISDIVMEKATKILQMLKNCEHKQIKELIYNNI